MDGPVDMECCNTKAQSSHRQTSSLLNARQLGSSHLTVSLQSSGVGELQRILQNGPDDSSFGTTFLGVSPPLRNGRAGGAANPLANSSSWKCRAWSASANNLQALRDLDRSAAWAPFMQRCDGGLGALLQQTRQAPEPQPASGWLAEASSRPMPFACVSQYYQVNAAAPA